MFWFISIGILVGGTLVLGIAYRIRRHEVGKRAASRGFLTGIIVLVITIIILTGLYLLPLPLNVSRWMIVNLALTIALWVYLLIRLRRKKKAGPVLLDIGRTTLSKLIPGGLFLLVGIIHFIEAFKPGSKTRMDDFFSGLLFLSVGAVWIFLGLSRLEIREAGFLSLDRLALKWEQIKSYKWEGEDNLNLVVRLKKGFMSFRTRSFEIPAHHKEAVEKLLEKHLKAG
jgi:Ca2+/Na+ antiporter